MADNTVRAKITMPLEVNLNEIIRQAMPQIFGSDERAILADFLGRCTEEDHIVEIDLLTVSERSRKE